MHTTTGGLPKFNGKMIRRIGGVFTLLGTLMLSGCVWISDSPATTDLVRDEPAAIEIAKKACGPTYPVEGVRGYWRAMLHSGVWTTQFATAGDTYSCSYVKVLVHAADGRTDGCELCIRTD